MFLMIAAMGLSTTYQNLANVIWGSKFKQLPRFFKTTTLNINGIFVGTTDLLCIVISLIVLVIVTEERLCRRVRNSRRGLFCSPRESPH